MAIEERDPHTGYTTIGHEWNGITELNRPVPKAVWFFLSAAVVFSLIYWVLMPAWPLVDTYTKGVLGVDQRSNVAASLRTAAENRSAWTRRIETLSFEEIQSDTSLMRIVQQTGRPLFEDNCAACHGMRAQGGAGYPRLTDGSWLWGGNPATVAETIRVGINSSHAETRVAQMPAFGSSQILDRKAILDVVAYVRSLSGNKKAGGDQSVSIAAGAKIFAANCVTCHRTGGIGNTELGAPNLTDDFWIYGGDRQSVFTTVYRGRQGHMPHWEGRLSTLERRLLTLYILNLGAAK